jgi:hypothetical protein
MPHGAIGCDDNDIADKCDLPASHRGGNGAWWETPGRGVPFRRRQRSDSRTRASWRNTGLETTVLKPEEKTKPSVSYRGHEKAMESKIPKARMTRTLRDRDLDQPAPETPKRRA